MSVPDQSGMNSIIKPEQRHQHHDHQIYPQWSDQHYGQQPEQRHQHHDHQIYPQWSDQHYGQQQQPDPNWLVYTKMNVLLIYIGVLLSLIFKK